MCRSGRFSVRRYLLLLARSYLRHRRLALQQPDRRTTLSIFCCAGGLGERSPISFNLQLVRYTLVCVAFFQDRLSALRRQIGRHRRAAQAAYLRIGWLALLFTVVFSSVPSLARSGTESVGQPYDRGGVASRPVPFRPFPAPSPSFPDPCIQVSDQ